MSKLKFFFSVLLIAGKVFAQLSLGGFVLLNSSGISGEAPEDMAYTSKIGFGGGAIADFRLNEEVTLSLQPTLIEKGTIVSYDLPSYVDPRDSLLLKTTYLTFPIMIKFDASKFSYFSGGFEIAYLKKSELKLANINKYLSGYKNFNNWDVAVNFAFGITLPITKKTHLFMEGRYSKGVVNVSSTSERGNYFPADFKNSSLQLIFGVKYDY